MTHFSQPQRPEPLWRVNVELPTFSQLDKDLETEVAIVGAGIAGITTAYLLQQEGMKVTIIDSGKILNGTTGHTTAKVTIQHGLIYDEFISHFGLEKTKIYYQANQNALEWIKNIIHKQNIDCNWSEEDAIIYTNSHQYLQKLVNEGKAYEKLNIPYEFLEEIPMDIQTIGAIAVKNQAQYHPLKYLINLVKTLVQNEANIFENTTAINIEEGNQPRIITREGKVIKAKHVIVCSHFPFLWRGLYFARMYAERAYVVAAKTEKEYPGGMYITAEDPTRSLREVEYNGEKVVLFIGENHKTGQGIPTMEHYHALEQFANKTFGIKEYLFRWSTQDLTTLDKLPYVGHLSENQPNIYVATGFRKWGMTNSTAAAHLIKDLIVDNENPYKEVVTPTRFQADPNIRKLISINFDVATHLVKGKLEAPSKTIDDLVKGEGAVVQYEGERKGAYKDENGFIHVVDTTCTHLGCELEWNSGDRTWDCPCHGSRFSCKGEVIEGPAERSLSYKTNKINEK